MKRLAKICTLGASLCGALFLGACATGSGGQPYAETPIATPDGGTMAPPNSTPTRQGVIVPGDPSAGSAGLGSPAGNAGSSTGTSGSRINPGSTNDGK